MRLTLLGFLFLLLLVPGAFVSPTAVQYRGPDTPITQPGTWPTQGTKRQIDVTQLKNEAQELQKLVQPLPEQIDKIGNGVLPSELIESLKKIEKLSKHIRSEVT
jgi:hypothetical protein